MIAHFLEGEFFRIRCDCQISFLTRRRRGNAVINPSIFFVRQLEFVINQLIKARIVNNPVYFFLSGNVVNLYFKMEIRYSILNFFKTMALTTSSTMLVQVVAKVL